MGKKLIFAGKLLAWLALYVLVVRGCAGFAGDYGDTKLCEDRCMRNGFPVSEMHRDSCWCKNDREAREIN